MLKFEIEESKGSYKSRSSGTKTNRQVLKIPDFINFWILKSWILEIQRALDRLDSELTVKNS